MVAIDPRMDGYKTAEHLLKEGIDVICGGFPCQDISVAGRGEGITGERSGLWRQMLRTIRLVRPKYAILENVAMLLHRGMGTVLGGLAESGYDTEWDCISAADIGAPHRRERIWIVAHTRCFAGRLQSLIPDRTNSSESVQNGTAERMANTNGEWESQSQGSKQNKRGWFGDNGKDVPYAQSNGTGRLSFRKKEALTRFSLHSEDVSDSASIGQSGQGKSIFWRCRKAIREGKANIPESKCVGSIWRIEPDVGRVADGVPMRVDRLTGLGNAVVPELPEIIGDSIMQYEQQRPKGTGV